MERGKRFEQLIESGVDYHRERPRKLMKQAIAEGHP